MIQCSNIVRFRISFSIDLAFLSVADGVLRVSGQLGSLSVSDLSPNGIKYRERFVFAGKKAMDFDIQK